MVKEGIIPLDQIGVKALDDHTLEVLLEHPTPYFLELVTLPLFSPISHKTECLHPNWALQEGKAYICNGPFCVKRKNLNFGYVFIKNPRYWDADAVNLDQIFIRKVKGSSAYEMFAKGAIDWIGRLFPYWDPAYTRQFSKHLTSLPSPKVSWCVFNTQQFPFNNQKIRKALSLSIDRERLISCLNYQDAIPATSPLPLPYSMGATYENWQTNACNAQQLFEEGLREVGLGRADFPPLHLLFPSSIILKKMAHFIKQQWEQIFGITSKVALYEWPELFQKICKGDYQACLITWTSWVNDPIYTLNAFKYHSEELNFSKWEHPVFQNLLDLAGQEEKETQRSHLLSEAEKILIEEAPVSPLIYERNQCLSQNYFYVYCDPIYGYPDFKWAHHKGKESDLRYFFSYVSKEGLVFHKSIRINPDSVGSYQNGEARSRPDRIFNTIEALICDSLGCNESDLLSLSNTVSQVQGF